MSRRLAAAILTGAALTVLAPLAPANAEPCELGCIIKCVYAAPPIPSFCPPV